MSNIETPKTALEQFKDNVKEKLQDDIGSLIPDAVLKEMVESTVQETFFKREMVKKGSHWNAETVEMPSWFEQAIKDALVENMKVVANNWIEENQKIVKDNVEKYLDNDKLFMTILLKLVTDRAYNDANTAIINLTQNLQNSVNQY